MFSQSATVYEDVTGDGIPSQLVPGKASGTAVNECLCLSGEMETAEIGNRGRSHGWEGERHTVKAQEQDGRREF